MREEVSLLCMRLGTSRSQEGWEEAPVFLRRHAAAEEKEEEKEEKEEKEQASAAMAATAKVKAEKTSLEIPSRRWLPHLLVLHEQPRCRFACCAAHWLSPPRAPRAAQAPPLRPTARGMRIRA